MMEAVISYFRSWDFFRLFRLALGIIILIEAIGSADWMLGILSLIFSAMAVFNLGCSGSSACYAPDPKNLEQTKDIHYTEIK